MEKGIKQDTELMIEIEIDNLFKELENAVSNWEDVEFSASSLHTSNDELPKYKKQALFFKEKFERELKKVEETNSSVFVEKYKRRLWEIQQML